MVTKSIQRFVISACSILFVVVALISCGDHNSPSSDDQGSVSHDGTNMTIDFPVPGYLASSAAVIVSLQAQAIIDGGNPYDLNVDPGTNQISGIITGVAAGTHELVITYFVSTAGGDVVLCRYSTQVTVNPGETTYVTILDTDLDRNIDDDQDGVIRIDQGVGIGLVIHFAVFVAQSGANQRLLEWLFRSGSVAEIHLKGVVKRC